MTENTLPKGFIRMEFRATHGNGFDLRGYAGEPGPQGMIPFAGLITESGGQDIGSFHAKFPQEIFARVTRKRRRGAPNDEPRKVAIALAESLVQTIARESVKPALRFSRVAAGRAMGFRGDDAYIEKYMRDEAKSETAKAALAQFRPPIKIVCDGAEGSVAIAPHKRADVRVTERGIRVVGSVWIFQWGRSHATFGHIDVVIPLER